MRATLLLALLLSPLAARAGDDGKVALGKRLFFDKRLSRDDMVSCASCHDPRRGWTDQQKLSTGVGGRKTRRNSPTLLNAFMHSPDKPRPALMWDGRAAGFEEQARLPLLNPDEMGATRDQVERKLGAVAGYRPLFKAAYGDEAVTLERVVGALAAFEETLVSTSSPYDRWRAGDARAMSPAAVRGLELFMGKASCFTCHYLPETSDFEYHDIGVGAGGKDLGRAEVTGLERDRGSFRTPTLRDLKGSYPYFHDGSAATLREVVDFYDKGGAPDDRLDARIQPLGLRGAEKKDLLEFLDALNGEGHVVEPPADMPR